MGWKEKTKDFLMGAQPTKRILQNIINTVKDPEGAINNALEQINPGPILYSAAHPEDEAARRLAEEKMVGIGAMAGPSGIITNSAANFNKIPQHWSSIADRAERAYIPDTEQILSPNLKKLFAAHKQAREDLSSGVFDAARAMGSLTPEQQRQIILLSRGQFPEMTSASVLRNKPMEEAYSDLYRTTPIRFYYEPDKRVGGKVYPASSGYWSSKDKTVNLNLSKIRDERHLEEVISHELGGHGVQDIPVKSGPQPWSGGSPELVNAGKKEALSTIQDILKAGKYEGELLTPAEIEEGKALLKHIKGVDPDREYMNFGGEKEARVGARAAVRKYTREQFLSGERPGISDDPYAGEPSVSPKVWTGEDSIHSRFKVPQVESSLEKMLAPTDVPSGKDFIEKLGFKYNGESPAHKTVPGMHWFTDPVTGGTYTVPVEATPEDIINHINGKRQQFNADPLDSVAQGLVDEHLGGK